MVFLTKTYETLLIARDFDTTVSLQEKTGFQHQTVLLHVRWLKEVGLIKFSKSVIDGRKTNIFLTQEGKEVQNLLNKIFTIIENQLTQQDGSTKEENRQD